MSTTTHRAQYTHTQPSGLYKRGDSSSTPAPEQAQQSRQATTRKRVTPTSTPNANDVGSTAYDPDNGYFLNRDPGHKPFEAETPDGTVGWNGTIEPTKNGGFTAPLTVNAPPPNRGSTDGETHRGPTPSDLALRDNPSDTSGLYRFEQAQTAGQHSYATHEESKRRPMGDTAHR